MRFGIRGDHQAEPRGILSLALGGCAAALALTLFCQQASAQFFDYNTKLTISGVAPPQSGLTGNGGTNVVLTTALGTPITFQALDSSGIAPFHLGSGAGGTDIVLSTLDVGITGGTLFENLSFDFLFQLGVSDFPTNNGGAPSGPATFNVAGTLSGTIGPAFKLNLNSIIVNPIPSQVIGGDIYTVTFSAPHFLAPGPIPGPGSQGRFGVHVSSVPVPEPATLTLMALGALLIATPAIRAWRRKSDRGGFR